MFSLSPASCRMVAVVLSLWFLCVSFSSCVPPETDPIHTGIVWLTDTTVSTDETDPPAAPPPLTEPETEMISVETEPETVVSKETEEVLAAEEISLDYVLNTNTKKFHYPTCSSVKKIKAENYSTFAGSREEAIAAGYDPCGNCKP